MCHVVVFMKLVKLLETYISPVDPSRHMASTYTVCVSKGSIVSGCCIAYCTHNSCARQAELGSGTSSASINSDVYSEHTVSKQLVISRTSLTVYEVTIVVGDALAQVQVTVLAVALGIEKGGAEDRDVAVPLKGEVDVLCCLAEVLAVPGEVACHQSVPNNHSIGVSRSYRQRCRRTG
jgi:hypothetical protein